jgi:hypothetical protein
VAGCSFDASHKSNWVISHSQRDRQHDKFNSLQRCSATASNTARMIAPITSGQKLIRGVLLR